MPELVGLIIDDGGTGEEARSLFVWVCEHNPGDEGIVAHNGMPMMAAQYGVAQKLKPIIKRLVRASGKPMRLVRYDAARVMEEVRP